nr:unnamed protein product [Callosobruchus analis]CAI5841442.1 unnamed protein product [Callosobruchus analis]
MYEYIHCCNREDRVRIHRLRLGHTYITHSYILSGEAPPICEWCDVTLTVKHILCECEELRNYRHIYHMPDNLKECLSTKNQIKNTLQYIRAIGLYWKI